MVEVKFYRLNLLLLMAIALISCGTSSSNISDQNPQVASREDTRLVLNNAILEQSNKQDNTVWKIKADNIVYSEDKKIASLDQVVGNLLQNDKIILKISAKEGEVRDNGNIIVLKEQIVASDPRNGSVMESSLVEWRPQENLLLIESDLTVIHPNLEVTARRGQYATDTESLEIEGDIVATTEQPALQLTSDRLIWKIPQGEIISPGAITVVRFDEGETTTDRLVSDRAKVNLTTKIATLNNNIELISLEPKIQVASDSLIWNYQRRTGKTTKPIQIVDRDRNITLTGNQGEIDLQQQIAKLNQGIKGINQPQASQIYANQATWNIATKEIEATGNVIYEQVEPKVRLTGAKAAGNLSNNQIVVTSNGKKQVTSVINN